VAQQEPIRVVVEKKGGCFSGCGTAFGVLLLIGLAVKYWYIALSIVVLVVVTGAIINSQQKQKANEAERRRSGPRDPWLNEVAVALAELGLNEVARNTGGQLGGTPAEGDIGLQDARFLVYVNLFASTDLARQAEVGLRAQSNIRDAIGNGHTMLKACGPVLLVANGRGKVVDDFRVEEVARTLSEIPLPPVLGRNQRASVAPAADPRTAEVRVVAEENDVEPLEQIRRLAELRDSGLISESEFEANKTELLRRL
jgi:hypothetical protein